MNMSVRIFSVLASCALTGVAVAADSAAHSASGLARREPVTFSFRYDADELATREGAHRVYIKLAQAARRECAGQGRLLAELVRVDIQCISELVDKAVIQTGSTQLAGVHRGGEQLKVALRR